MQPAGFGGAVYVGMLGYGNVYFFETRMEGNHAARGGGAVHVCAQPPDVPFFSTLYFINSSLSGNSAYGDGGGRGGGGSALSRGGALQAAGRYLQTTLVNSSFANNRAGAGGAVDWAVDRGAFGAASEAVMDGLNDAPYTNATPRSYTGNVLDTEWPWTGWSAVFESRWSLTRAGATRFEGNAATAADGGAAALRGRGGVVVVLAELTVTNNSAPKGSGGGFHIQTEDSALLIRGTFAGNIAAAGGGGLFASGATSAAHLVGARFERNEARLPGAAGGGFCCSGCGAVSMSRAAFRRNAAAGFGGGASVVRARGGAAVAESRFERNRVGGGLAAGSKPAAAGKRSLLQAAFGALAAGTGGGAPGARASGTPDNDEQAGGSATGNGRPDEASALPGDDMLYEGGGGLYVSAGGQVVVKGSTFTDNDAPNGGGVGQGVCPVQVLSVDTPSRAAQASRHSAGTLDAAAAASTQCLLRHLYPAGGAIVRTDACTLPPAPGRGPPPCLLLRGPNRVTRNSALAGIGGGLLVTNASLAFADCAASETTARVVPLRECWRSAAVGGVPSAPLAAALGLPFANEARDADTSDLASVVARLVVTCAESVTDARFDGVERCGGAAQAQQPATPRRTGVAGRGALAELVAPPGGVLRVDVAVLDWMGSDITSGFDSSLVVQVRL